MNNNGPWNKPGLGYSPFMRETNNRVAAPWNDPTQQRRTYGDRPGALMSFGRGMSQYQSGPQQPPMAMPAQQGYGPPFGQIDPNRVNPQMPSGGMPQGQQYFSGQRTQTLSPGIGLDGRPINYNAPVAGPGQATGLMSQPPKPVPPMMANRQLNRLGADASLGQINRRLENPAINEAQRQRLQARANKLVTSGQGGR